MVLTRVVLDTKYVPSMLHKDNDPKHHNVRSRSAVNRSNPRKQRKNLHHGEKTDARTAIAACGSLQTLSQCHHHRYLQLQLMSLCQAGLQLLYLFHNSRYVWMTNTHKHETQQGSDDDDMQNQQTTVLADPDAPPVLPLTDELWE